MGWGTEGPLAALPHPPPVVKRAREDRMSFQGAADVKAGTTPSPRGPLGDPASAAWRLALSCTCLRSLCL